MGNPESCHFNRSCCAEMLVYPSSQGAFELLSLKVTFTVILQMFLWVVRVKDIHMQILQRVHIV